MAWRVEFDDLFNREFETLSEDVQDAILEKARLLSLIGPSLGRPHADTLKGSRHANMKELRCQAAQSVWRVAFAFDPDRRAILLVGGSKSGRNQARYYKRLVDMADERFDRHLATRDRRRR